MAFYRSYFVDAGMGNEEKILAELESPEKVAEIIKRDLGMVCTTGTKTDDAQSAQNTGYQNYTQMQTVRKQNGRMNERTILFWYWSLFLEFLPARHGSESLQD